MLWTRRFITLLPDSWQDKILARVIAGNRWERVPTFNMLFESYVLLGADRDDLVSVFSAATDLATSLYQNSRRVARRREEAAARTARDGEQTRQEYQKALMLYFLADWISFDEQTIAENYYDLLRVSAKIDELERPKTEKIYLPWSVGHIAARFRYPDKLSLRGKGCPVVMLLQGNDTVKETLLFIEDELLRSSFAVLNVDQPGWGESRLSGNRYRSLEDARALAEQCLSFCKQNALADAGRVAVLGFSGGGTWAAMTAGTDPRIRWLINVGGAIYELGESIQRLPAMQKRQVMKHWGCREGAIAHILLIAVGILPLALPIWTLSVTA